MENKGITEYTQLQQDILDAQKKEYEENLRLNSKVVYNPCGKPHNNGEDSCNECLTIKEGI